MSLYPFEVKEGPERRFLIDVPFGRFSFQAEGYINKGRGFLSDAPVGRFSDSLGRRLPRMWRAFSFSFLLKFLSENVRFGRFRAQLILAALSLCLPEVKESPERRFLSDAPFGWFCLPGPRVR